MDAETDITSEIAEYPEAGPFWVGLWAVARHWVAILVNVFEPDVIATADITRSFALRCRNWLWPIEGLVRRLIIAAAMKLDASQLPKPIVGKSKPTPSNPHKPTVAFTILPRLPGRGGSSISPRPAKPPPEHRHLLFPGDGLLNLFPRHNRRNARTASRRSLNPLHRRGRISRWDPDYQGDSIKAEESHNRHFSGLFLQHAEPFERPPQVGASASRSQPRWPHSDLPEWKRIEMEWERVIPSPGIAGRIRALARVLEKPERWIERTARRLTADLIARIRAAPPPKLKKPKLDRSSRDLLAEALALAQSLIDTS
jgi:hypothetical protein